MDERHLGALWRLNMAALAKVNKGAGGEPAAFIVARNDKLIVEWYANQATSGSVGTGFGIMVWPGGISGKSACRDDGRIRCGR